MAYTQRNDAQQTTHPSNWAADPNYRQIRDVYEEFEVGNSIVAMVSDPMAQDAWIQSNVQAPIRL